MSTSPVPRRTPDEAPRNRSQPEQAPAAGNAGGRAGAAALQVPRSRFVPVKTTNELLVVRSDAYELAGDWTVRLAPARDGRPPLAELDADHFKLLPDFEARFEAGPPSLAECERLTVEGDVSFGRDVVVRGSVVVAGPARIEDGTVLEG